MTVIPKQCRCQTSSNLFSESWVLIAETPNQKAFLDKDSLTRSGDGQKTAWVKYDHKKPGPPHPKTGKRATRHLMLCQSKNKPKALTATRTQYFGGEELLYDSKSPIPLELKAGTVADLIWKAMNPD